MPRLHAPEKPTTGMGSEREGPSLLFPRGQSSLRPGSLAVVIINSGVGRAAILPEVSGPTGRGSLLSVSVKARCIS